MSDYDFQLHMAYYTLKKEEAEKASKDSKKKGGKSKGKTSGGF